ncbi:hypothetical protein BU15DRAFT_59273 [Melanogaster broomeanus]|nr:hypothetical protein BU15DRAFT_59273 [Melanogaster broomeanus]
MQIRASFWCLGFIIRLPLCTEVICQLQLGCFSPRSPSSCSIKLMPGDGKPTSIRSSTKARKKEGGVDVKIACLVAIRGTRVVDRLLLSSRSSEIDLPLDVVRRATNDSEIHWYKKSTCQLHIKSGIENRVRGMICRELDEWWM